jgi:hypothetical protein
MELPFLFFAESPDPFSSRLLSSGLHGIVHTIHQMILVGGTTVDH